MDRIVGRIQQALWMANAKGEDAHHFLLRPDDWRELCSECQVSAAEGSGQFFNRAVSAGGPLMRHSLMLVEANGEALLYAI